MAGVGRINAVGLLYNSFMELYMTVNAAGDQMMLVSLFDNLGKGSSGAAIQCMNLMLGMDETEGLE